MGKRTLTAAVTQERDFWVARCLEVEVTSQGKSFEESMHNLKEALELYFEDQPLPSLNGSPPIVAPIEVEVAQ